MFPYDETKRPPHPSVRLRITDSRRNIQLPAFSALVDSGADCSCLPSGILSQVPRLDYERGRIRYADGQEDSKDFVRMLRATIEWLAPDDSVLSTKQYNNLRFVVLDEALLGRDILNYHRCELDGPALLCVLT